MKYIFLLPLFAGLLFVTTINAKKAVVVSGSQHVINLTLYTLTKECNKKSVIYFVKKDREMSKEKKKRKERHADFMNRIGCKQIDSLVLHKKGDEIGVDSDVFLVAHKDAAEARKKGKLVHPGLAICDVKVGEKVTLVTRKSDVPKNIMESPVGRFLKLHKLKGVFGFEGEGDIGLKCIPYR